MEDLPGTEDVVAATGVRGRIVWAVDERGRMPAREFWLNLPQSDQRKLSALFRRFVDHGSIQNKEKFRELTGEGLYEFKIWGIRLLGNFVAESTFLIAHAVKKKTSGSLLPAEFEKARRLLNLNLGRYREVSDAPN